MHIRSFKGVFSMLIREESLTFMNLQISQPKSTENVENVEHFAHRDLINTLFHGNLCCH